MGRELSARVLEGDLEHFFPSEMLQLMQLAQATGALHFERPGERAALYFERGRPVFARTDGGSVRVGEILLHRGQLTREALDEALAAQKARGGGRLGATLVAAGHVTPAEVQDAVREVLRRIVYGLLLWRQGRFHFAPGERLENEDIQLDLDLDRLILEGLRIADQTRPES
jgi:hypothetical protein